MKSDDRNFAGPIPEIYDKLLVPLIFEPFAADLAAAVSIDEPHIVLETAAGTGAVTRALAMRLPKDTRIVATDLNDAMIERARTHQNMERIVWRTADATNLPFGDGMFDDVICQFGAMFFSDKVQGHSEAYRVLKPGGHYHFNVWDDLAENEFARTVSDAVAEVFPRDPPNFMARTPHGYADEDRLRTDLAEAGFSRARIDRVSHVAHGHSAREVATGFCQGTPLRMEIEARDPAKLQEATSAAAEALRKRFGSGVIHGRISALMVNAVH